MAAVIFEAMINTRPQSRTTVRHRQPRWAAHSFLTGLAGCPQRQHVCSKVLRIVDVACGAVVAHEQPLVRSASGAEGGAAAHGGGARPHQLREVAGPLRKAWVAAIWVFLLGYTKGLRRSE